MLICPCAYRGLSTWRLCNIRKFTCHVLLAPPPLGCNLKEPPPRLASGGSPRFQNPDYSPNFSEFAHKYPAGRWAIRAPRVRLRTSWFFYFIFLNTGSSRMQLAHRRQQRKRADVHQRELQTKTQHTHKPPLSHQTPLWGVQVQKSKLSSLKSHIISSLLSLVIYLAHLSPAAGSRPSRYFSSISTFKSTRWSFRSINYLLNAGCLPKCRLTGWRVSLARCVAAVVARLCASYWYSQKYANDGWHHQVHRTPRRPLLDGRKPFISMAEKHTFKNRLTEASYDYIPEEINVNKSIKRLGFLCYSTLVCRHFLCYDCLMWVLQTRTCIQFSFPKRENYFKLYSL